MGVYKIKNYIKWGKVVFLLGLFYSVFLIWLPKEKEAAELNWNGSYYNNKNLTGNAKKKSYESLKFTWNRNAPMAGIKQDQFSARFEKLLKVTNSSKDYFLHAYADDGIRVYVDNKKYIDSWKTSTGQYSQSLINLAAGSHKVKTEYYDEKNSAALYADVLPFGTWIGYYYNNRTFSGYPQDAKTFSPNSDGGLSISHGRNKPNAKNIAQDNFSMKLFTYKRLEAGKYIVRTKVDDNARIYIDGKEVLNKARLGEEAVIVEVADKKGANKDAHEIRIDYVEKTGNSYLNFSIVPLKQELSTSNWLASYYNNQTAKGTGFIEGGNNSLSKISSIMYNWDYSAPNSTTQKDSFSASYFKLLSKGNYFIHTYADDGIKASLNGKTLFSRWSGSTGKENKAIITNIAQNNNILQLDYLEKTGKAFIQADVLPFGQWLGYYYPNNSLKGLPTKKRVIKGNQNGSFSFNVGKNAPISGIPKDNYSANFLTAMKLSAGDYVIHALADDGMKIYIDDRLVVDRWNNAHNEEAIKINIVDNQNEKDVHWIRVEYKERTSTSKLSFDIKPISQSVAANDWLQIFYANKSLSGTGKVLESTKAVQYNWEKDAPLTDFPKDSFSASFFKKLTGGKDYFISSYADDGIRVKLDNKMLINRWKNSSGVYDKALVQKLSTGSHIIQTDYYDSSSNAAVFADVQPLGNWIAYFYNNKSLSGAPIATKTINNSNSMTLTQNYGKSSPVSKVNKDNFSAKYITAKKLTAGEYIIRGLADDGVKVYLDGKLVVDNWRNGGYQEKATKLKIENTNSGNIHWIEVRYFDHTSTAKFQVSFEPYQDSNFIDSSGWSAEYYPKVITADENPVYKVSDAQKPIIVGGKGSLNTISDINFDWKKGSPDSAIPSDKFSAIFKREINITESTTYNFTVRADNGTILEIDGKKVVDAWFGKIGKETTEIGYYLSKGKHQFVLRYKEGSGNASIKFSMEKAKSTFTRYEYTSYPLNEAVSIQMTKSAQTDKKYSTYISENAFSYISSKNGYGLIDSGTWNVRGGPSTSYWIVGKFKEGSKVTIKSKVKDNDGDYWYEVDYYKYWKETKKATADFPAAYSQAYNTWVNAGPDDVQHYMDAANFKADEKQKLQFLVLSSSANVSESEVNANILTGKGILAGKAGAFIEAGEKYGVNEIYLISHALLETGNGTSSLAKGITVSTVDGKKVTPKKVYNMYGIGAYDAAPIKGGSEYAYKQGWDTPEKAIIGGAEFIGENYINNPAYKQNTLYEMRWNPKNPGVHQYATDIGWASKQVNKISSLYEMLSSYRMDLEIPKYK